MQNDIPIKMTENGSVRKVTVVRQTGQGADTSSERNRKEGG